MFAKSGKAVWASRMVKEKYNTYYISLAVFFKIIFYMFSIFIYLFLWKLKFITYLKALVNHLILFEILTPFIYVSKVSLVFKWTDRWNVSTTLRPYHKLKDCEICLKYCLKWVKLKHETQSVSGGWCGLELEEHDVPE